MVRDVVANCFDDVIARESRVMSAANSAALRIMAGGLEAALEPAPRDVLGVQQVADVPARDRDHRRRLQLRVGQNTLVVGRAWITDRGACVGTTADVARCARGS